MSKETLETRRALARMHVLEEIAEYRWTIGGLLYDKALTPIERVVALALWDVGECRKSDVEELTGVADRTLRTAITHLEARGIVEVDERLRRGKSGDRRAIKVYRLVEERLRDRAREIYEEHERRAGRG